MNPIANTETELTTTPALGLDARTKRELTKPQKATIGAIVAGAISIAGIGFAGSYNAVVRLAIKKDFGDFARVFPLGVDVGIGTLLALDLLLTFFRMPFPLLRYAAWGLTGATIAFNVAASWGDEIAVGMHATMPILFVLIVEAGRHAVGRMAKISSGAYYENPPLPRWFLAPWPTYRVWRRMRMWNIRSYTEVILMEQESKVFRTTLRIRYGRGWKRQATKPEQLAIRLAKLGKPIGAALHEAYGQAAIEAPQDATVDCHEGATEALPPIYVERPESAMASGIVAPQPVIRGAIESALAPATEAPQAAASGRHGSATHDATVDLVKRPQSATAVDAMAPRERYDSARQSATNAASEAPQKRPVARPRSATKAPRPTTSGRPTAAPRDAARDAIKALYADLGRRPLESEMVAALKAAKLPKSRQFANARRLEIEREHPELAALGSDNVRPITGTDG
ncbi:DUF2637 domain-containing protein [Kitasatospora sp. NPDC048239]|uniref:DUF2637 domain-containing protein n=1 Tax=Kitasatospora sp. NPDC048239 TaxID=3364046 RepID=UPI003723DB48